MATAHNMLLSLHLRRAAPRRAVGCAVRVRCGLCCTPRLTPYTLLLRTPTVCMHAIYP